MERLLDRNAVAEYLGVNLKLASELMRGMTCIQVGKRLRVSESALAAWLRENERLPETPKAARQKQKKPVIMDVPPGMYRAPDGTLKFFRVR